MKICQLFGGLDVVEIKNILAGLVEPSIHLGGKPAFNLMLAKLFDEMERAIVF